MQKHVIQPARPDRRGGTAIIRILAYANGPLAHAARAADHGKFHRLGSGDAAGKKIGDRFETRARGRTDQGHRSSQLACQREHVHAAVLLVQFVRHVQQHQRRQTQRDHAPCQHQVAVQVGGIQNHDDRIGTRHAGHVALQHVDRDFLVFRLGRKAVDAGQIDQRDFFAFAVADVAGMVLDGDAGKVADLLAQSGEPIEERGLAGIGRTYDSNGSIRGIRCFVLGARHRMARHR